MVWLLKLMTLLTLLPGGLMSEAPLCSESACHVGVQLLQTTLNLQQTQISLDKDGSAFSGKIAVEEHVLFSEINYESTYPEDRVEKLVEMGEKRLRDMDSGGIRIAVLSEYGNDLSDLAASVFSFDHDFTGMNASQIVDLQVQTAKQVNDLLYEHMNGSSRYRGFAALPMLSPIAAAAELTRCVNSLGFVGAMIKGTDINMKHITGKINYYDTDDYDVLWQKFEKLDVPLYIHPRSRPQDLNQFYETYPMFNSEVWASPTTTAELVLSLMEGGVFERFKGMKVILGHMGEMLPFWASRMDRFIGGAKVQHMLSTNFFVTTSGFFDTLALQHVIGVMGVERVLYATDYTAENVSEAAIWFERAVRDLGLNETEKDMIEFKNAEKLLRIT